jgi:hypothetical protein
MKGMLMNMSLPICSRCGKPSILKQEWDEKIVTGQGVSILKHQQYVCQDDACQTKVEETLQERKKVSEEREQAAKEREELRNARTAKPQE